MSKSKTYEATAKAVYKTLFGKDNSLTLKEIDYIRELVAEAWFCNRSVMKLSNIEQTALYSKLQSIKEVF
jgi:hypothetical protein